MNTSTTAEEQPSHAQHYAEYPHYYPVYTHAWQYQGLMESMPQTSSKNPNISAYADLQNSLRKLHQVLYSDAYILDTCTTLHHRCYVQINHLSTNC